MEKSKTQYAETGTCVGLASGEKVPGPKKPA